MKQENQRLKDGAKTLLADIGDLRQKLVVAERDKKALSTELDGEKTRYREELVKFQ